MARFAVRTDRLSPPHRHDGDDDVSFIADAAVSGHSHICRPLPGHLSSADALPDFSVVPHSTQMKAMRGLGVALALVVAACGGGPVVPKTPPAATTSPTAERSTTAGVPVETPSGVPTQIAPNPTPAPTVASNDARTPWRLAAWSVVDRDTQVFDAIGLVEVCDTFDRPLNDLSGYTVAYEGSAVVLSMLATPPLDRQCRHRELAWEPITVNLEEAIGDRRLVDPSDGGGSVRWRPPPMGEIPLPVSVRHVPPGMLVHDICAGVGLDGVSVTGDPEDPRIVWLRDRNGRASDIQLLWPAGYTARFTPQLEVLDEAGAIVMKEGHRPEGGCVQGDGILRIADPIPNDPVPSP